MTEAAALNDNPTRMQIGEAVAKGLKKVRLDSNPAFVAHDSILEEAASGEVLLSYFAGPETTQGNGVVSGGTLASMLDCAMAAAVMSALKPMTVPTTVSLMVNMLRPGAPGRLYVSAKVDRLGRTMAFSSASIMNEERVVLATASSSLAIITL